MRRSGRILALGVALFALGCGPPRPRHLVLITIDTFRADHFGAGIADVSLTPTLSELAEESLVFEDASSVASETSPGIAGILTGVLPHRSGVIGNRHMMPDRVPALAPILRAHGFRTAAFVANPVLDAPFGFARGFETFELIRPSPPQAKARGEELLAAANAWLRSHASEPRLFLWLHFMEPHGPYTPPPTALAGLALESFEAPRELATCAERDAAFGCVPGYQVIDGAAVVDGRKLERSYAAEIRHLDSLLGEWLRGPVHTLLDRSVVALTADHGEALAGDHGFYFAHGLPLSQDQVRVPLLFRAPGVAPRRIAEPVSTVSLAPTALALLGLPSPPELDGVDLLTARPAVISGQGRHDEFLRVGALELRRSATEEGRVALYDLASDPREAVDLAASRPLDLARLTALLAEVRSRRPLASAAKRPPPGELREEELRSLGYL